MPPQDNGVRVKVRPGYKQTGVGVIPEDWETPDLASITNPNRPISYGIVQTGPNVAGGVRCLRVVDIDAGHINRADLITTSERISASYKRTILIANDLVIPLRGKVGDVGIIDKDLVDCNLTRGVALIAIRPESSPRYCKQAISSSASRSRLEQSMNGSALQELPIGVLRQFKLALPTTKAEQEAIAEALSDADALIESLEQLLTKKRQIKKGAMQELLTGKTRLPGFSKEWEVKRLGDIAFIKTGTRNNQDKSDDGEYPFFVRSETVERISSYSYDCEAILIPGEGGIGSIFHYISGRFDVHQRVYAITQFSPGISGRFVNLYMIQKFGPHAKQNSVKATVDSLRLPTFQKFELMMPPTIEEQVSIATILSHMDAEIAALEAKLSKARLIKQGMMQELLTGKVRLV